VTTGLYKARVVIQLNDGVNDPQGLTVRDSLYELGFDQVQNVRIGKIVMIDVAAVNIDEAEQCVEAMCSDLLANPVIESFEIETLELGSAGAETSS
jgi:phosphoribosylformylglycinamidine synthase PurS subunit